MTDKTKVPTVPIEAASVMPEPPTRAETPGLKSFWARYWQFLLVGVIALGLVLNNTVFKFLGSLIYLPLLVFSVFILAFVIRYALNKRTTDAYIHTDGYEKDFASLPAVHKCWLTAIQFFVYLVVIAMLAAKVLGAPTLEQQYNETSIRPEWKPKLDAVISGIVREKDRYVTIQKMRENGMPWWIVGSIHERESSRNFARHLHEGSPLIHKTYYVPRGRLPAKPPPYSFEQSAEDALYILKTEHEVKWANRSAALDAIETYNGLGYRRYHSDVLSPYLWSGTKAYIRGKYVADGRFDRFALDRQPGVAALWKRMEERKLL